jgi:hypothetical protein
MEFDELSRLLHKPLLLAGCGARPEAEQNLSPPRTLGGCSKFQIGYYTPKVRREVEQG